MGPGGGEGGGGYTQPLNQQVSQAAEGTRLVGRHPKMTDTDNQVDDKGNVRELGRGTCNVSITTNGLEPPQ